MRLVTNESNFYSNNLFYKILFVLFFLFVVLYFYRLGDIGLIDVDEPRYAEASREMLESSNWVVPYFNYSVRFDKPILFYWLEAISMKVFGVNEFSARLPSALSALLCVTILFYFIKIFSGAIVALLTALILMSSFEFAGLSRFSITDMTLASSISSCIICFFLGYYHLATSHRFFKYQIAEFSLWYILAFFFLALAVLIKGPFAIVAVGLILFPFFWWTDKLDYFFKSNSFWVGFVLFLILVFPWYIAVHLATNGEFTKAFFGMHNLERYTSVVSGHRGSIFYFIPVVFFGFLPWTFFLPQAISAILRKPLRSLLATSKDQVLWFCLWWFLVIFLFFSFSKTKLLTYILSLFPAISVIVGLWFEEIIMKRINNKGLIIGLGIFFLFSLLIMYVCLFNLNLLLPREIKDLKLDLQIMFFAFLMFVGVSMAWASSHKNETMTFSILLSTFFLLYFCLIGFVLPKIDRHSQYLLRTFAKAVPRNVELATYQIIKPSLTFYAKRQIQKIDSLEELQEKLNQKNSFAFIAKRKTLEGISLDNAYVWKSDNRYVIFTNYP